jgi:hypothetical protein
MVGGGTLPRMSSTPALHPRRHLGPKLSWEPKPETPLSWACEKGKHYACTKADCPCVRHLDENQKTCTHPENHPDRKN